MSATLYVNKPGGVIVHLQGGGSKRLGYGEPVPENVAEYVDPSTFADGQRRVASFEQQQAAEAQRRAALAENGQVNSSSSPVPSNYSDLDEDTAARLMSNLSRYPEAQAKLLQHEMVFGGGRQKVVDAASDYAKLSAGLQLQAADESGFALPEELPTTGGRAPAPFPDPTRGGMTGDAEAIAARANEAGLQNLGLSQEQLDDAKRDLVPPPSGKTSEPGPDPQDIDAADLKGAALESEIQRLNVEGASSMSADDKRAAVAEARAKAEQP
jgi:hypothetical protein